MTIDTDRSLSVTVDIGINFQSNHPLHQKLGLAKTMFHRTLSLVSKPDDMSEQTHLRQCLNQCGYKNCVIDHTINFSKRHNAITATSIQNINSMLLFRMHIP